MARCGGHSPAPRRCGGGPPLTESIVRSIETQMGDAYTRSETSVFRARNLAVARMIAGAWGAGQRLRGALDPVQSVVPDQLSALVRKPIAELEEHFATYFEPSSPALTMTIATDALGSEFSTLELIPKIHWNATDKSSGAGILLVRVAPAALTGALYSKIERLMQRLTESLPAWQLPQWYVPSPSASGSPAAGFYLDETANLDHQILD